MLDSGFQDISLFYKNLGYIIALKVFHFNTDSMIAAEMVRGWRGVTFVVVANCTTSNSSPC